MKEIKIISLFIISSIGFIACNLINPKEEIPTYIHIDSFSVKNNAPTFHGSVGHKITDAWVYLDNQIVGVYQLPATVPILFNNENAALSIRAGIWNSGFEGNRISYPFYSLYNDSISPNKGGTIQINPSTSYNENTKFHLIADFEQGNSFIKFTGDTSIIRSTDPQYVKEGNYAGVIFMDQNKKGSTIITANKLKLPSNQQCFIEMDYRCNIDFKLEGQIINSGGTVATGGILTLKARPEWNKIYINITDIANNNNNADFNFKFNVGISDESTSAYLAIDNFKVLSF